MRTGARLPRARAHGRCPRSGFDCGDDRLGEVGAGQSTIERDRWRRKSLRSRRHRSEFGAARPRPARARWHAQRDGRARLHAPPPPAHPAATRPVVRGRGWSQSGPAARWRRPPGRRQPRPNDAPGRRSEILRQHQVVATAAPGLAGRRYGGRGRRQSGAGKPLMHGEPVSVCSSASPGFKAKLPCTPAGARWRRKTRGPAPSATGRRRKRQRPAVEQDGGLSASMNSDSRPRSMRVTA